MNKFFILTALGSITLLHADQSQPSGRESASYPSSNTGGRAYQTQPDHANAMGASDREILKKIHESMNSDWFSTGLHDVSFDIHEGDVNLRGTVDTAENKKKVEDSVKKIGGVKSVNNQLTLKNK